MPGKQVGKLSIRVVPDTTTFKADLKKLIERIENTMSVNLKVEADTRDAQLEVRKFVAEASRKTIDIKVSAATSLAKVQMAAVSRDRVANLIVRVQQASIAKAAASLGALSGLRLTTNILRDFNKSLSEIDVNLPKIARLSLGLSALASSAFSGGAGLVTLAGDLVKMFNVGLVLPAALTAMAVGITVLVVALKDAKVQLAELGPAFSRMGAAIKENYWAEAKGPIIEFVRSILPELEAGVERTATALGKQTAAIASAFQDTLGGGVMTSMFDRLVESMDIVTTGAGAFAQSLTTLGTIGSNYLPRLAQYVVDVGNSFNSWVQINAANGMLDKFIGDGITAIQDFGRAVGGIVGILRGIDSAATAAGGGGLSTFADAMQGAAKILQSPEVQTALTSILRGADAGLSAIGGGLKAFGDTLVTLAPTISAVLTLAGQAIGGLVTAISGALEQPEVRQGLINMFTGIKEGVDALGPAMAPLAQLFAVLATAVGVAAANFGPLLATLKGVFAPVLEEIITAITPLIPLLVGGLIGALQAVTPMFAELANFIGDNPEVIASLVLGIGALAVAFRAGSAAMLAYRAVAAGIAAVQLGLTAASYGSAAATYATGAASKVAAVAMKAQAIAAGIVSAAQAVLSGRLYASIAAWVASTAATVASGVATLAARVALIAGSIATGVATAAQWLFNAALAANPIGLIIAAIVAVVAALVYFFTQTELGREIWANFTQFLTEAWANIVSVATTVFTELGSFFNDLWNGIVTFVTAYVNALATVITTVVTFIVDAWNNYWTGLGIVINTVWTGIVSFITGAVNLISQIITNVVGFIVTAWNAYWMLLFSVISTVWNSITSFIGGAVQGISDVITNVVSFIVTAWNTYWSTLFSIISTVFNAVVSFVASAINNVRTVIVTTISAVSSTWAGIWAAITGVVGNAVSGIAGFVGRIVSGIQSLIGTIASTLSSIPGKIGEAFSNAGQWLFNAGKSIVQGLIDGIRNMIGRAASAASDLMGAVANFFPHSPAKEGPFSGRGWTPYSGRALGAGFASGIEQSISDVRRSALAMSNAAVVSGSFGVDVAAASTTLANRQSADSESKGDIYNIDRPGASAQEIATELRRKKQQANILAGLKGAMA